MDKYSVLMSVYYKEKPQYLRQSIESIMTQTVMPDEFVIVCDGPLNDELDAVLTECAHKYKIIKLVRLPENVGLGKALNEGIGHCTNEIVARMDSDDISISDRMERELLVMEKSSPDIVSGTVIEFKDDVGNEISRRVLPADNEGIRKFAKKRNPFNHPAVMYRKSAVVVAGGYRHCPYFEDYDLWIRMLCKGCTGANIPEPVLYMRSGDDLYKRRGGISYAGNIISFRWKMFRYGYSGSFNFLVTALGHSMVAIIPNGLRKFIYEKVLRK